MSDGLQIRQFNSELYPELMDFANSVRLPVMLNQHFVQHYYLGQEWSRLFLVIEHTKCIGIIGVELLEFVTPASSLKVAFATNFYSLQPGIGGMLWLKWMKLGDMGLVFGGSQDAHRILTARKFDYYSGINLYRLNAEFEPYNEDSAIKGIVKAGLRPWKRKKLTDYASKSFLKRFADIQVVERHEFSEGHLVHTGLFMLRFHPKIDYLQWRYNLHLPHARYRLFEFLRSGQSCGYCVLNDGPKELMVAYSDGNHPELIAAGILKAIFSVGDDDQKERKAVLASSNLAMQTIFSESGFRLTKKDYPFAVGSLRGAQKLGDPRTWHINLGLGDNDLRPNMFWPTSTSLAGDSDPKP